MGYIDFDPDWANGSVVLVVVPQGAVPEQLLYDLTIAEPSADRHRWCLARIRRSNGLRAWIGTIKKGGILADTFLRVIILEVTSTELLLIAPNATMVLVASPPADRLSWDAVITACLTTPPIQSLFRGWGRPSITHTVHVDCDGVLPGDRLVELSLVQGTKRLQHPDPHAVPNWLDRAWLNLPDNP